MAKRFDTRAVTAAITTAPKEATIQAVVTNQLIAWGGGDTKLTTALSNPAPTRRRIQQVRTKSTAVTTRNTSEPRLRTAPSPTGAKTTAFQRDAADPLI
jgi:hypothetical protein